MKRTPQQHTGRVVALALAFFGSLAVLGYFEGVFARLSPETSIALVTFAIAYAFAIYALDAEVRGWIREGVRRLGTALRRPLARATKAAAKSPGGTPAAL